jgi:cyanate permease
MIADRFGWEAALQFAALLAMFSAFLWLFIDAANKITPTSEQRIQVAPLAAVR